MSKKDVNPPLTQKAILFCRIRHFYSGELLRSMVRWLRDNANFVCQTQTFLFHRLRAITSSSFFMAPAPRNTIRAADEVHLSCIISLLLFFQNNICLEFRYNPIQHLYHRRILVNWNNSLWK